MDTLSISEKDLIQYNPPKDTIVDAPEIEMEDVPLDSESPEDDVNESLSEVERKQNPPVQLEWKNIRYDVKVKGRFPFSKKKNKTVLYPMSGYVKPGEVLAILGPSGAGKTSLLNILAQRELNYGGSVRVNGKRLPSSFLNFSAYVEQDDVMHPNLTVKQVLKFASYLRLPTSMDSNEKSQRVKEVIQILGLEKCSNTKIGTPGGKKGISGGERKRLAIAVEILKGPSLLFLDEPTSGMDSKTSLNIVKAIRNLALRGTTVVMTIHQPRSQIYDYFDQLLLLADGKVAYHGLASKVDDYFTEINPTYALPKGFNIADHSIDLITRTTGTDTYSAKIREIDEKRIKAILRYWEKNRQELSPTFPPVENAVNLSKLPNYSAAWYMQYGVLFVRNLSNLYGNKMITIGKALQSFVIIFFLGTLFFRIDNNQSNIQDRLGLLFFLMLSQVMNSIFAVLTAFPIEYRIFKREKSSRAYSTTAYYLAKVTAELPYQIFFPALSSAVIYYIVGFNPLFVRYIAFICILSASTLAGIAIGEVLSVVLPKVELGLVLAPIVILAQAIFSGFYITRTNIPPYYIWIYYLSIFSYAFKALMINEFDSLTFYCKSDQYIPGTNICPVTDGRTTLRTLSMDEEWWMVWIYVCILLAFTLLYKILGFVALSIRTNTIRSTMKRYIRNRKAKKKEEAKRRKKLASSSLPPLSNDVVSPHL